MSNKAVKKTTDTVWSPVVKIVAIVCAVVLLASIALAVVAKAGYFRRTTVVMTVGDSEINALEYNQAYYSALNSFYSQYYYYASMIGFDASASLKTQKCYFDASMTWYDYFVNQAKIQLEEIYMLYGEANANGEYQLSEEGKKNLDDSIKALEDAAAAADVKLNKYVQSIYGPNMTFDDFKEFETRRAVARDFYDAYIDGLSYDAAAIEKYYSENKNTYDRVKYYSYTAKADSENKKSAEDVANDIKAAATDEATYLEAIKGRENADTFKAENYLKEGATYTKDNDTSEWLFAEDRKAGDVTVIKTKATSASGSDTYTVLCFVERARENYKLATMRHILFSVEELKDDSGAVIKDDKGNAQTNDAEQKLAAEKLLKDWQNGAATEDSFAALVKDNSDDTGSVENGGLYEDFDQAKMTEEITDWIWAEGRKAGDCEVVKTTYGYHIVYFVGYGEEEKWNVDAVNAMKSEDYQDYLKELRTKYPMTFNNKGLSQVG
ncbi:MAG: peptidylprolyl isomerase [Clostridia bacterium]|nr:peptidylprolyl isomerase [Clostridia bacterium]